MFLQSIFILSTSFKLFFLFCIKKTEVYITITAMIYKFRVICEWIFGRMLQHEKSSFFQQVIFKNQIRNFSQILKFVRLVGKNHIKLCMATGNKLENIGF